MQNSSEYPDHLSVLSRALLMFFFPTTFLKIAVCPGGELMICKYSYKRQTRAPCCALYSSPRQRTVGTPPAVPARKAGLKSASPAGDLLSLVWACPRPEQLPIPYLHVMNNNTQGKILYYTREHQEYHSET